MRLSLELFAAALFLMLVDCSQAFTAQNAGKTFTTSLRVGPEQVTDVLSQSVPIDMDTLIPVAVAAGATALVAGAAAFVTKPDSAESLKQSKELLASEPEPVDVSIPYDSAARLAYDGWRMQYEKGEFDEDEFNSFSKIYEEMSVATVSAKKIKRDAAELLQKAEEKVVIAEKCANELETLGESTLEDNDSLT